MEPGCSQTAHWETNFGAYKSALQRGIKKVKNR